MSKDRIAHYIKKKLQEPNRPATLSDIIELAQAIYVTDVPDEGRHISKSLSKKQRLFAANPYCTHCRRAFITIAECTLDHIIPKSKGGNSKVANLQLLCMPCNQRKADNWPYECSNQFCVVCTAQGRTGIPMASTYWSGWPTIGNYAACKEHKAHVSWYVESLARLRPAII